jgi:hypothetical protein
MVGSCRVLVKFTLKNERASTPYWGGEENENESIKNVLSD